MRIAALIACALVVGCGASSTPSSPSPPGNPNTITISAAGAMTPAEITVAPGSRVLFVNNHSRLHEIASDLHPDHLLCPAINTVGVLNPGQSRETSNLIDVGTCGFHDHQDSENKALQGRIIVR